jgi:hypothetical protein
MKTCRGLMIFVVIGLAIVLAMLLIMQEVMRLNITAGMLLAVLVAALSVTALYVRHSNSMKERKQIRNARARLIQLQNTVRIRYVNNVNLLDYMYLKYGVSSGDELESLIGRYKEEKHQRMVFEEAEKQLGSDQKELIAMLRMAGIKNPEVWLHQAIALINHNEEVEVRHALIVQRQNLRKRMDYNREMVVGGARSEIEDLARSYPNYSVEILDQVARFRGVTV